MQKLIVFVGLLFFVKPTFATLNLSYSDRNTIYNSIDFKDNAVDQNVFNLAFKGYLKLKQNQELKKENILSIIDYSKPSTEKRLWVIDLANRNVLFNEWVAHGKNTGNLTSSKFSNTVSSKQSSLGFFITGNTYNGKHAYSLKLHGVENRFNSNAFKRGIVIHGASYVSQSFINAQGRLGRSFGCPAIRQEVKTALISTIKDGSCLFSYYPSKYYLQASSLLN